jgi:signal transduction histidine kinase
LQVLDNKRKESRTLELTTTGGRRIWLHITLQSVVINAALHLLVMAQDLTEIKSSQQRLQDYADKLQRSNYELEQFAYVASHDLQEPLRSIISFNQILQEEYTEQLDPQAQEYFRLVTSSARHMQSLIQDLLDYSRLGTQGSSPEWFDISKLIPEIEGYLHDSISRRRAQIHWSLPAKQQKELLLYGDAQQMGQVLYNLISNGLKYNEAETPSISIVMQEEDSNWRITVTDNGIGIAPKQRERVFQMFQRLHPRQKYSGTGIGLAMVHKIIRLHGGDIWIEDNPPQGSRFVLTLPKPS